MATSTAISGTRPQVRGAVGLDNQILPVLALDWANGQEVAVGASSAQSAAFDANNDRIVAVSSNTNCWISVGTNPTATKGAGSIFLGTGVFLHVYVPLNNLIAVLQDSAGGAIAMVPALRTT